VTAFSFVRDFFAETARNAGKNINPSANLPKRARRAAAAKD
jgi:hypothetical protein